MKSQSVDQCAGQEPISRNRQGYIFGLLTLNKLFYNFLRDSIIVSYHTVVGTRQVFDNSEIFPSKTGIILLVNYPNLISCENISPNTYKYMAKYPLISERPYRFNNPWYWILLACLPQVSSSGSIEEVIDCGCGFGARDNYVCITYCSLPALYGTVVYHTQGVLVQGPVRSHWTVI